MLEFFWSSRWSLRGVAPLSLGRVVFLLILAPEIATGTEQAWKTHNVESSEPDCVHWLPSTLDPEPEQCWCLRCGDDLPCACALRQADPNESPKEMIAHA